MIQILDQFAIWRVYFHSFFFLSLETANFVFVVIKRFQKFAYNRHNKESLKHWWVSALRRQGALFLTARTFLTFLTASEAWNASKSHLGRGHGLYTGCVSKTTLQFVHFPGFFIDFSNTWNLLKKPTSVCYDFTSLVSYRIWISVSCVDE